MFMTLSGGTGVKLEFRYDEVPYFFENSGAIPTTVRKTTVILFTKPFGFGIRAFAICSPKDQFRKAEGRRIALQRLMAQLSKADRAIVGQTYFKRMSSPRVTD